MKTITQKTIAEHFGVTESFVSDIRAGRKGLDKLRAKEIAERSYVSLESLLYLEGEDLYHALLAAYQTPRRNK